MDQMCVANGRTHIQKEEYEHGLQSLGSCKTVEEFWKLYCSLPVIGTEGTTNYSFFRVGVWLGIDGRTALNPCGRTLQMRTAAESQCRWENPSCFPTCGRLW